MKETTVRQALAEARRFERVAEALLKRAEAEKDERGRDGYTWQGCPETAACRRASMDLTRALAKMRGGTRWNT